MPNMGTGLKAIELFIFKWFTLSCVNFTPVFQRSQGEKRWTEEGEKKQSEGQKEN